MTRQRWTSKSNIEYFLSWLVVVGLLTGMLLLCHPAHAGSSGGDGPGGVGSTDGSSSLKLWLKADRGVTADAGCTTPAGAGNPVACWADQSGSGNHFTQSVSADQPTLQTGIINGQPALQFDGINQYLEKSFTADLNGSGFTAYFVAQAVGGEDAFRSPLASICNDTHWSGYIFYVADTNWLNFWASKGTQWSKEIASDVDSQIWHIAAGYYDDITSGAQFFDIDGTNYGEQTFLSYYNNTSCPTRIGAGETQQATPGAYFPGYIAEVIVFNTALPLAQRTLINNYLSEKYNLDINGDIYSGSDPEYTIDVSGIGKESDGSNDRGASAGMTIADDSFLLDNGDYILIGHTPAANHNTNDDLPNTGDWADGNNQRWSRVWYLHKTDRDTPGGTVDIAFDISDSGMSGNFSGSAGNYRLLKRAGTSGVFSDIAAASSISDGQALFDHVDASLLGSYFTLGTVDNASSPTAIMLQGFKVGRSGLNNVIFLLLASVLVVLALYFIACKIIISENERHIR